jgi:hypothetical protein
MSRISKLNHCNMDVLCYLFKIAKETKSNLAGITVLKPAGNLTNIEFFYASPVKLERTNFLVKGDSVDITDFRYSRTLDWNENETRTKFTYRFRLDSVAALVRLETLCQKAHKMH